MGKTFLITGSSGFIGRHLGIRLAGGSNVVVGVDLHHSPEPCGDHSGNFREVAGDFRDRGLMEKVLDGVDVVFHLASAHLQVRLSEAHYWDVNVHSLRPFLETARRRGVQRFVHVSSAGVYGNLESWPADEETPCRPANIYGETKLAGEMEVRKCFEETQFPAVILRPSWVYGPGCPRTLKIYRTLLKKRFVMIGNGNNLRHPVYIKDMVDALVLSGESMSAVGETIIIGGDQTVTTRMAVDSFCRILELPKPKIKVPMVLGEAIATGLEKAFRLVSREPPLSRRSLEFFDTTNAFDISKARRILGFCPSFSFEEGLRETRSWLEENVWGKAGKP